MYKVFDAEQRFLDNLEVDPNICYLGGGKSSGGGTTTTTQKADPWTGIQPDLLQAAGDTQGLYNNGGLNFQYYPGQTVANQSPYTQLSTNLTAMRGLNGSPVTDASQQQVTDTLNGKYLDPQSNPYFQGTLNNTADAYARGTHASTDAAFNRAGAYGGSAYTEQTGANNKAFADSLNDLDNTQYQQARTQQLQAAALAPQIAGQDYTDLQAVGQAGTSQDAYNQSLINANIDRYNFNQQAPANNIQNYIDLLNGVGGNYKQAQGTSTTSAPGNSTLSGIGTGIQALGTAATIASLFSDINLKENIEPAGTENGHNIYKFNYKGDDTKYIGVMAQEIQQTHPEAVERKPEGLAVFYDKIGVNFRRAS